MSEQEIVFANLTEFILHKYEENNYVYQYSVTFFYNLLCVFDNNYKSVSF